MRKKNVLFILALISIGFILQSFVGNKLQDDGTNKIVISKKNGITSHFFALNCMTCHKNFRNAEKNGRFTAAGSVYDEARARIHKNPVIKLYTEPKAQGKLMATINGDKFGNFFTTENIDFTRNGLYPVLYGSPTAAESIKYMETPIFKGDCNSCHGPRAEALGID